MIPMEGVDLLVMFDERIDHAPFLRRKRPHVAGTGCIVLRVDDITQPPRCDLPRYFSLFIKDSISLPTIWALSSRAQGEVISADSY